MRASLDVYIPVSWSNLSAKNCRRLSPPCTTWPLHFLEPKSSKLEGYIVAYDAWVVESRHGPLFSFVILFAPTDHKLLGGGLATYLVDCAHLSGMFRMWGTEKHRTANDPHPRTLPDSEREDASIEWWFPRVVHEISSIRRENVQCTIRSPKGLAQFLFLIIRTYYGADIAIIRPRVQWTSGITESIQEG